MNEKPKSIWTRPWQGRRKTAGWFAILFAAIFAILLCFNLAVPGSHPLADFILPGLGLSLGFAILIMSAVGFGRWICCWRNLRRFLFGIISLITLIALFYAVENFHGKWAWKKYQRAAEAKGEKLDFAAIVPPPVPDEQNFAMQPIWVEEISGLMGMERAKTWYGDSRVAALGHTNPVRSLELSLELYSQKLRQTNQTGNWQIAEKTDLSLWQNYYRQLATSTNYFPVAAAPQTPAAAVLLALSRYDAAIETLRAASQLPYARFPLTYTNEDKAAILLPHLASLKSLTTTLRLRACAELQANQSHQALEDITLMTRMNDALRLEPFLISHLVNIAMFNLELQPVWEGLADHRWNDRQLVTLDTELARFDFLANYQLAIRGERAWDADFIDYMRWHPDQIRDYWDINSDQARANYFEILLLRIGPSGWFEQNKLALCRFMTDNYLSMVNLKSRTYSATNAAKADEAFSQYVSRSTPYNWLSRKILPALANAPAKFIQAQAATDLARVAIALERHRLARGEFPETLAALEPQFIARLPHDVVTGQPLKYRRAPDGSFILYSVGWNETDDGGNVTLTKSGGVDAKQGDWVWRSTPQTEVKSE